MLERRAWFHYPENMRRAAGFRSWWAVATTAAWREDPCDGEYGAPPGALPVPPGCS
ncbi:hypothetical protein HMPREF0742_02434 [Rothia aeria F0184]|uniref:Uncharacterized protein n=1 Tax=Rothia aeria F0184 TaxID=888019 RepID=U7UYT1_9MICC|nr:hypothetical protein HMPREF0742_02434 [Rothia aeria F0184]